MALPAVMMAYKERGNILQLIFYAFVGIAVLYLLWKIFKAFKKLGKVDDAVKEAFNNLKKGIDNLNEGIKESVEEIKEYGVTKPLTPKDTLEILEKRASKNPDKPYYVEESIYKAMLEEAKREGKSLPKNVIKVISVPTNKEYKKAMTESGRQYFDSKFGLDFGEYRRALEETKKEETKQVGLKEGSKAWKKQVNIEASRWNAMAKYYQKRPEKSMVPSEKANPMPKSVLLEKLRIIERMRHPFVPHKPVYKYQPLPKFKNRFLR